jgi:NADP-dependent 3-hydroxy acid dehydrogenase YdfG
VARRKDKLTALAADITAVGGTVLPLPADVTGRAAVQDAADQVAERWGQADIVFNNAGVQLISAIDELKTDEWQQQIDLNVTGVMNVIAAFIPHLTAAAERGGPYTADRRSGRAATAAPAAEPP